MARYYIGVPLRLQDVKNGKFDLSKLPENQPEVTMYLSPDVPAQQFAKMLAEKPLEFDRSPTFAYGEKFSQPLIFVKYEVDIQNPKYQSSDMKNWEISEKLNPKDICNVEIAISADTLHKEAICQTEHNEEGCIPDHQKLISEMESRAQRWNICIDEVSKIPPEHLAQIDLANPETTLELYEMFGENGWMQSTTQTREQQIVSEAAPIARAEMTLMTHGASQAIAEKAEQFYETFEQNLLRLAGQNPEVANVELALHAMTQTIDQFQQMAIESRNLPEQTVFGDMRQMNAHMFSIMDKEPGQDMGFTSTILASNFQKQREQLPPYLHVDGHLAEAETRATLKQVREANQQDVNDNRNDDEQEQEQGLLDEDDFTLDDDGDR